MNNSTRKSVAAKPGRKRAAVGSSAAVRAASGESALHDQRHLYVWDRLVLQLARGTKNNRHRHFGAFLLIAPDAPIEVHVEPTRRILSQAVVVAPNVWHRLDSRKSRVATLLVGPDHEWFGYVVPVLQNETAVALDFSKVAAATLDWDRLFGGHDECSTVLEFVERTLASLTARAFEPHCVDSRIQMALSAFNENQGHMLSPAELGQRVGLSAVTLMRRFKRELGVRMREYALWRRLLSTIPLADGRHTLTEIAHLAGFYDQAHLTRTARRMFDIQPSTALSAAHARIHVCECRSPQANK